MSKRRRKRHRHHPLSGKCQRCERSIPDQYISNMVTHANGVTRHVAMCPCCALAQRNQMHGLPLSDPFQGEAAQTMLVFAVRHLLETGQEVKPWELEAAGLPDDPIERATEWIET